MKKNILIGALALALVAILGWSFKPESGGRKYVIVRQHWNGGIDMFKEGSDPEVVNEKAKESDKTLMTTLNKLEQEGYELVNTLCYSTPSPNNFPTKEYIFRSK